jgi:hypothetical protein
MILIIGSEPDQDIADLGQSISGRALNAIIEPFGLFG